MNSVLKPISASFLTGLFCLGFVTVCLAAPLPNSAEGELANGADMIVRGSGFGSKFQAAPILFDTQDKIWINGVMNTPYSGVSDGDPVPTGNAPLPFYGGIEGDFRLAKGPYPHYYGTFGVKDGPHDIWTSNPNGFPSAESGQVQQVYIRWWFNMSGPVNEVVGSNKFIRVRDTAGNDYNVGVSWTTMHASMGNAQGQTIPFGVSWANTHPVQNQWNLMEFFLQLEPTGDFKTWLNGKLIHDKTGWSAPAGHQGIRPRLWGMDGSGDSDFSGDTLQLSDYYADSTRARVEIGDAAQWSNVSIREPQILTFWGSDEIRFQVYKGRLNFNSNNYLYVIDADGNVNESGMLLDDIAPPAQMPKPAVQ